MKRDELAKLYKEYNLTEDDVFKHKHYMIITRAGVEKIQAQAKVDVVYEAVKIDTNFAVIKAIATKEGNSIQTFGSALKGLDFAQGNTNSWYVTEMAEKRAMSRAVLKITGFYELGAFGEDESEDFKKEK